MIPVRLSENFLGLPALEIIPRLMGAFLVRHTDRIRRYRITEVEVYSGEADEANHARKGRTQRTRVMYEKGGLAYVYLVYGMHWMFNIVTGPKDYPEAILVRGVESITGPGRLTKALSIDGAFNGEDLCHSNRLWLESSDLESNQKKIEEGPRIGIHYAGDYWRNIGWRFRWNG